MFNMSSNIFIHSLYINIYIYSSCSEAGRQRPIRHRHAKPRSKRSLSDQASSDSDRMADKRKKGGCTVNSVESRSMGEEGETTEILRSTGTD